MSDKIPLQQLLRERSSFQDVKDPNQVEQRKRALHQAETQEPAAKRMKVEGGTSYEVTADDFNNQADSLYNLGAALNYSPQEIAAKFIDRVKQNVQSQNAPQAPASTATGATMTTQFNGKPAEKPSVVPPASGPTPSAPGA